MSSTLSPPANEHPIAANGAHTDAWLGHFQDTSDAINTMHTGVVDASNARAGQVGEVLTASGGPLGITNNTPTDIASLSLTAGDWLVDGFAGFNAAVTTHPTQIGLSTNTVSATLGDNETLLGATFNVGAAMRIGTAGAQRVNVAVPTTVYLVGFSTFTISTMSVFGTINARRVR